MCTQGKIRYANGWRLQLCLPPVGEVFDHNYRGHIPRWHYFDGAADNNANIGITLQFTVYINRL